MAWTGYRALSASSVPTGKPADPPLGRMDSERTRGRVQRNNLKKKTEQRIFPRQTLNTDGIIWRHRLSPAQTQTCAPVGATPLATLMCEATVHFQEKMDNEVHVPGAGGVILSFLVFKRGVICMKSAPSARKCICFHACCSRRFLCRVEN